MFYKLLSWNVFSSCSVNSLKETYQETGAWTIHIPRLAQCQKIFFVTHSRLSCPKAGPKVAFYWPAGKKKLAGVQGYGSQYKKVIVNFWKIKKRVWALGRMSIQKPRNATYLEKIGQMWVHVLRFSRNWRNIIRLFRPTWKWRFYILTRTLVKNLLYAQKKHRRKGRSACREWNKFHCSRYENYK